MSSTPSAVGHMIQETTRKKRNEIPGPPGKKMDAREARYPLQNRFRRKTTAPPFIKKENALGFRLTSKKTDREGRNRSITKKGIFLETRKKVSGGHEKNSRRGQTKGRRMRCINKTFLKKKIAKKAQGEKKRR